MCSELMRHIPQTRKVRGPDQEKDHIGRGDEHGKVPQRLCDRVLLDAIFVLTRTRGSDRSEERRRSIRPPRDTHNPKGGLDAMLRLEPVGDELEGLVLVIWIVTP